MKYTSIILPVLLVAIVGIAGCEQPGKKGNAKPADMADQSVMLKPEGVSATKLNLYSQAYKTMMSGQAGLKPSLNGFVSHFENVRINEDIFFPASGKPGYAMELFRQGYAIPGSDMPELDKNVLDVMDAGVRLMAQKDAGRGQARALNASLQKSYEALFSAMDRMEPLLFKYRKCESEKRLASFKKSGNTLGFYTEQSIADAQNLLALFAGSNETIKDSDVYDRGDVVLAGLEASLAKQRVAYENVKSTDIGNVDNYLVIHRILTSMIGSYRDLRQNRTLSDLSSLNKKYNEAIQANNRLAMLSP